MVESLKNAVKSGHGNALIVGIGAGLIASDIIPTPADAIYFRTMARNKQLLEEKKISPKQYWTRDAVLYYGLNPLWWTLVVSVVVLSKGDFNDKAKLGLALIGAGAVVGVISKNIREEQARKK